MSNIDSEQPANTFVTLDFDAELTRMKSADHGSTGRFARPVVNLPGLRLVLVSMRAESTWSRHSTPGRVTVQPISGQIRIQVSGRESILSPGKIAALASSVEHDVFAMTDSLFLLTVARPNLD